MRVIPKLLCASWIAALAVGCGPNLNAVYEADQSWNQCTSMDQVASVNDQQRYQCWLGWKNNYAGANQTNERNNYVNQRIAALSASGTSSPPSSGGSNTTPANAQPTWAPPPPATRAAPAPDTVTTASTPTPGLSQPIETQVGATQQPIAPAQPQPTAPQPTAPQPQQPSAPSPQCGAQCGDAWTQCNAACAANDASCVGGCDTKYRTCMSACR